MEQQPSYYEILNVAPNASDEDVKKAYRIMAKKFHPDLHPTRRRLAELRFRMINEAYAGLKTREKRIEYNRFLRLKAENDNKNAANFFAQIGEIFWPGKKRQQINE